MRLIPAPRLRHCGLVAVALALSAAEKAQIVQWVREGAAWEEHWAFLPEGRNPPPVPETQWGHNPIDLFVLNRLEQQRLQPSAPADRQTLLRRVTLDLSGLPPTPEEYQDFLADDSPRVAIARPTLHRCLAELWHGLAQRQSTRVRRDAHQGQNGATTLRQAVGKWLSRLAASGRSVSCRRQLQTTVPEVTDLADETDETFELYGPDSRNPGTYAANCLLARRLAERGVRFIQLYHRGCDHHGGLPGGIRNQCRETDQASAALVLDLERRGLLDETLVIWGGEFGRTSYSQGRLTAGDYGRDHHPRCFTMWMAGGGVKPGLNYGSTDDFGYNIAENPVHVHDFQATLMHLLGIDHERLTFKYQGRRFRLTDVHGRVVHDLLG